MAVTFFLTRLSVLKACADGGGDFLRAEGFVGELWPARYGGIDLFDDRTRFAGLQAELLGELQAVASQGAAAFAEDGAGMLATGARGKVRSYAGASDQ